VLRNAIVLFVSLCILISASARSEERAVQVNPAGADTLQTKPRQIVTAAFQVANVGKQRREYLAHVELPRGWQLVTQESPFQLAPGETDLRLVTFFPPSTAPADTYRITYSVEDRAAPSIRDSRAITVVVLPVAGLKASLLQAPQYVVAGEEYEATFQIINEGNSPSTVAVKVESSDEFPVKVDAEPVQLGPGDSARLTASVKTDPEIRRELSHRLRFTATAPGPEDQEVSASARSFVDVIPKVTGVEDPFHRLPVMARLRGLTESNQRDEQGLQAEVAGSGTLDEEGTKHIDFLFRGPDLEKKSFLGERDEYRLSYETEKYGIHLGDRPYSLSPLTESFEYGRGVEGNLNLGKVGLGAYRQESRWLDPKEEQTAAHVNYRVHENYQFGLNYLKKNAMGRPSPPGDSPKAIF
jgi:hypothetical protein